MLRTIFVWILIAIGSVSALSSPFQALLFYLWYAYFRPEIWLWSDFLIGLQLSYGIGLFLIGYTIVRGTPFRFDAGRLLVFAFLVQAAISTGASKQIDVSLLYFKDFAKVIVITYLISVLTTNRIELRMVLLVIAYSLGFEGAKQGWAQLLLNPGAPNNNEIPFLGDNNGVAQGMLALAPIFVALARTTKRKWERRLHRFFVVGVVYRGVSSYSRGGFVVAGLLGAVYVLRSRERLKVMLALGLLAGILVAVLPDQFWARIGTIGSAFRDLRGEHDTPEQIGEEQVEDVSGAGRLHFWSVATVMANARPLAGVGFNAYNACYDEFDFKAGAFGTSRSVHSALFGVLAEMGYPGLLLFLAIAAIAFLNTYRVQRATRDRPEDQDLAEYALALQVGIGAYLVAGLLLPSQYGEMYWHYVGLTQALVAVASAAPAGSPVGLGVRPAPVRELARVPAGPRAPAPPPAGG
jgi:probable O-glycosylation ligase (exosortase A-associated)